MPDVIVQRREKHKDNQIRKFSKEISANRLMLITPHVLLGAALTKRTGSLLWGIPLAFASHFMLDAIPNWDVGLTSTGNIGIVITDGIIALLLLSLLSSSIQGRSREKTLLWAGGFFGIVPDLLSQGSKILGIQGWIPLEGLHQGIQKSAHISWSLPVQILLSTILAGWVYCMTNQANTGFFRRTHSQWRIL